MRGSDAGMVGGGGSRLLFLIIEAIHLATSYNQVKNTHNSLLIEGI